MVNRILKYLRLKSGIIENQQRLVELEQKFNRQYNFLLSQQRLLSGTPLPADPELIDNLKQELLKEEGVREFNAALHKNDMMLAFHLYRHAPDVYRGAYTYFRVGARAARQLHNLCQQEGIEPRSIIDFGSGYGRMSRFLPAYFQARIIPTEVKPRAIDFQKEYLGFAGVNHQAGADSFPAISADLIIALSVFTHLPEDLAKAWLTKLLEALNPGGILIFTFHDFSEAHNLPADVTGQDFYFQNRSEDTLLPISSDHLEDTSNYGVTFMTKAYLERLLKGFQYKFVGKVLVKDQEAMMVIKPK